MTFGPICPLSKVIRTAYLIVSPRVGFANNPFSASLTHTSQASKSSEMEKSTLMNYLHMNNVRLNERQGFDLPFRQISWANFCVTKLAYRSRHKWAYLRWQWRSSIHGPGPSWPRHLATWKAPRVKYTPTVQTNRTRFCRLKKWSTLHTQLEIRSRVISGVLIIYVPSPSFLPFSHPAALVEPPYQRCKPMDSHHTLSRALQVW